MYKKNFNMDLPRVETELKKRWQYPYKWGRKQSDLWDKRTNFIYEIYNFETLLKKTASFDESLKNYALNRWYNFWSARAVEFIFSSHNNVVSNKNAYDKLVDFTINNVPFDHKTTIFPKGFNRSLTYAKRNKRELIKWLYINQSQQGRKHLKNRLFIVLFDKNKEHWKMKAEINYLKTGIDSYVNIFDIGKLCRLNFGQGEILSDIIWIEKL